MSEKVKTIISDIEKKPSWKTIRAAIKELPKFSIPEKLLFTRFLTGINASFHEQHPSRTLRIAFASDGSLENLATPIATSFFNRGLFVYQYHAPFAQITQEIYNPQSGLFLHQPNIIFLAPWLHLTDRILQSKTSLNTDETTNDLIAKIHALRSNFPATIVLLNAIIPEFRPNGILDSQPNGVINQIRKLNLNLSEILKDFSDLYIIDAEFLSSQSGLHWPTIHKNHFMSGRLLSDQLAFSISEDLAAIGAAKKGLMRKCLALDLDNTLWGGIIGEDGLSGIKIGGAYPGNLFSELQKYIKMLKDRGIILSIVSKNNETDAWEVFKQRSEMTLKKDDFSAYRINWNDKASNLKEIAAELNIGLDAFVLIDDNPIEREWVQNSLPEVEVCPENDPLEMLRWLARCRLFDTLTLTDEDRLRAASYKAAEARLSSQKDVDIETWLRSLNTEIKVDLATPSQVSRIAQLTQKTNQFNLTTRRYSESEIQKKLQDPSWRVYWCSCRDRFADEGIIATALVYCSNNDWHLDTFLMSCRVLGRSVEKAFLYRILSDAQTSHASTLYAEFIPTAKNAPASNFLPDCGFTRQETFPTGAAKWSLPILSSLKSPDWIKFL